MRLETPRGFTLVEVMVVVVIIAVMAALAVPSARLQLAKKAERELVTRLGLLYRQAHGHSLNRGAAVVVRLDPSASPQVVVLEGLMVDGSGTSTELGEPRCQVVNWAVAANTRQILAAQWVHPTVSVTDGAGTAVNLSTPLDICFSPSGRTLIRSGTNPFAVMNGAYRLAFSNFTSGLTRPLVILPNGTTRVLAAEGP